MHVHLLTLRYSPALGAFDTSPLQSFLAGRELLDLREHFFVVHEQPHLLCVISWCGKAARERHARAPQSGSALPAPA